MIVVQLSWHKVQLTKFTDANSLIILLFLLHLPRRPQRTILKPARTRIHARLRQRKQKETKQTKNKQITSNILMKTACNKLMRIIIITAIIIPIKMLTIMKKPSLAAAVVIYPRALICPRANQKKEQRAYQEVPLKLHLREYENQTNSHNV